MRVSVVLGENDQILACVRTGEIKGFQGEQFEHIVRPEAAQRVYEFDVEDALFEKGPTEINRHLQQMRKNK